MIKYKLPPLCPEEAVCPKCGQKSKGRIGVHSNKERRYKCHRCDKTFSDTVGTPLYGVKYPHWIVIVVLTLLAYGCPIQAIVAALGIDERTVGDWHEKAGQHSKQVQEQMICNQELALGQVQGDEMYVKTQYGKVWMATAISVFSRLFIWGAISTKRNGDLVEQVVAQVHAAADPHQPLLWATDGFAAWKKSILKRFRVPLRTGKRGRPKLLIWPQLQLVQVVKQRLKGRIVSVERRLVHGSQAAAEAIVFASQVDLGCFNTAYVERLNASIRTWLPAATRRSRTPAAKHCRLDAALFWTIGVYNFCRLHRSIHTAPAVAAGIIDAPWSIDQLIRFRPDLC